MPKKKPFVSTDPAFETSLVAEVLSSRKYRGLNIPEDTVLDLIHHAMGQSSNPQEIDHIVREKMHNLMAPYLGDPDYTACQLELDAVYHSGENVQIKAVCLKILSAHASTKERIPILDVFYERLFAHTGRPKEILDLACALNPFALPWMSLAPDTQYYAYDLHQPRLDAINHLFQLNGMLPFAIRQDILVTPPTIKADVAFFFKEAHRFELRRRGCNREFWQNIQAKHLLVSLPTASLTGRHSKTDQHRRLVMDTIAGLPWQVHEIEFENEIVFCIEKEA
jgi:16S rRNA (guanine(1405)-N(7))-methyltransferase